MLSVSHSIRPLWRFSRYNLFFFCCVALFPPFLELGAREPIRLHPENPHYFLWRGKPALLVGSGEHYGAVLNLDFDFRRYLAELARNGLNHTRTFSGVYREHARSFGITSNPLAPRPERYLPPWPRSDVSGAYDGGRKFDLSRFEPRYFERLKAFLEEASRRGVVVEFNLFCPFYEEELWKLSPMHHQNNINGVGDCPRTEVYTLKHPKLLEVQLAFVRRVVRELKDYDNLYYEVANEPYFGGVREEWQRKVIDTIVEVERGLGVRHLISQNIANGAKRVENPHPAVSIFNFHYCVPPDAVALNYHLKKAIGENETGFRGRDDAVYRTEAWDFLLAGGALFSHLDYSFTVEHPAGTCRNYKSPGGGSPELRAQFAILKGFLESFDFVRMAPAQGVLQAVEPEAEVSARILAERGKAYAVYLHTPLPAKPKREDLERFHRKEVKPQLTLDVPRAAWRVEWIDPKTGRVLEEKTITGGGPLRLQGPAFREDLALRLKRLRADG